jgi:mlo protein
MMNHYLDSFDLYKGFNLLQIILAIGTKLQATLSKMAIEITERHAVIQGIPLVQGSDKYFWFGKPQLILHLIHFALFQVFNLLNFDLSIQYFYSFILFKIF